LHAGAALIMVPPNEVTMIEKSAAKAPGGAARQARLARQLRENLRRRKAQARSRGANARPAASDSGEDGPR
jgi:hypothetical protein